MLKEQVQAAVVVLFQASDLDKNMPAEALVGSVNEGGGSLVFTAV